MRLLFVADGRSPTSRSWISHWLASGHDVLLVSTHACDPLPGLAGLHVLPVALGSLSGRQAGRSAPLWRRSLRRLALPARYLLGPLGLWYYQRRFTALVRAFQPDLVHALRIPFEGMLAASTPAGIPLLVSIWGNDLTLHAQASGVMKSLTRITLERADALLADAQRDIRLGRQLGFAAGRPTLVIPGAGGIRRELLDDRSPVPMPAELPEAPLVVNPRGQRPGSLRQDVFFRSIPGILARLPEVQFLCPALQDDPEALHWIETLGIRRSTHLWPQLAQRQLWAVYRKAQVYVSPSIHDGTPNSLLEAMACGCFPVVGRIESMQEWIRHGENGLLVDASSPQALADAIVTALKDPGLREQARKENARLIAERAEYGHCMAMAEAFYLGMLAGGKDSPPAAA